MAVRAPLEYPDWPLHRFVQNAADDEPDRVVVRHDDLELTFGELDRRGNALARALGALGVAPHERVALFSANRPEWLVAQHGVSLAGAGSVLGNGSWKSAEIEHALGITQPRAIIADDASATMIDASVVGPDIIRICLDDAPRGWLRLNDLLQGVSTDRGPELVDDPAAFESALPFSSGTTGMPKAVRHSHRGLVRGTLQRVDAYALDEADRLQFFMPLFTIFGVVVMTSVYATRASLRLFRRFDPVTALENVERERITVGFGTLPVATRFITLDDLERYDLSSLRYLLWGATPLSPEISGAFTARTGVAWVGAYATTEVGVASNDAHHPERTLPDSPGFAMADTVVRIVDPATGANVDTGTEGEIWVKSESMMVGYLGADGDDPVTADGFFRTGDLGRLDADGMIYITDRLKDLVKVNGFSVAPAEIERVLLSHAGVADCAAYGVPDPDRGEVLEVAVVAGPVVADRAQVDVDDLDAFLAERLARYKHPARIRFVDEIPRNAAGKTLRRALRDDALGAAR